MGGRQYGRERGRAIQQERMERVFSGAMSAPQGSLHGERTIYCPVEGVTRDQHGNTVSVRTGMYELTKVDEPQQAEAAPPPEIVGGGRSSSGPVVESNMFEVDDDTAAELHAAGVIMNPAVQAKLWEVFHQQPL